MSYSKKYFNVSLHLMRFKNWLFYFCFLLFQFSFTQEKVIGIIENDADSKPISNVHVINLNSVVGTISNKEGIFEIDANVNDTLFFSYLGFKSIKVRVTNDLIKFKNSKIKLTELAYALEEIIVTPYKLTGYLEIDAPRNSRSSKFGNFLLDPPPLISYIPVSAALLISEFV